MKNCLVTGFNGFLGSIVVKQLEGHYHVIKLGLTRGDLTYDLSKERPQLDKDLHLVVHLAGKAHSIPKSVKESQQFYDVNLNGTKNLFEGIKHNCSLKTRVVFISTVAVYGLEEGENISEDQWPDPNTPYGLSKFQAFIGGCFCSAKTYGGFRSSAAYMLDSLSLKKILSLIFPFRIISNSRVAIDELNQIWWLKHIRFKHFPNFIDLVQFPESDPDNPKEFHSISIGSLLPGKRLDRLFDLILEMKKYIPNIKHIHLGDGPLMSEYQKKIKVLELNENINLLGKTKAVREHLSKSKVFVHFSDFEGTPNVVLEAMAVGLPVISTNCGDVTTYLKDNENGFVIPKGEAYNPKLFLEKYHHLLDDESERKNKGQNSLAIIEKYNLERMAFIFFELIGLN